MREKGRNGQIRTDVAPLPQALSRTVLRQLQWPRILWGRASQVVGFQIQKRLKIECNPKIKIGIRARVKRTSRPPVTSKRCSLERKDIPSDPDQSLLSANPVGRSSFERSQISRGDPPCIEKIEHFGFVLPIVQL
jgi:hypothetical protein